MKWNEYIEVYHVMTEANDVKIRSIDFASMLNKKYGWDPNNTYAHQTKDISIMYDGFASTMSMMSILFLIWSLFNPFFLVGVFLCVVGFFFFEHLYRKYEKLSLAFFEQEILHFSLKSPQSKYLTEELND